MIIQDLSLKQPADLSVFERKKEGNKDLWLPLEDFSVFLNLTKLYWVLVDGRSSRICNISATHYHSLKRSFIQHFMGEDSCAARQWILQCFWSIESSLRWKQTSDPKEPRTLTSLKAFKKDPLVKRASQRRRCLPSGIHYCFRAPSNSERCKICD